MKILYECFCKAIEGERLLTLRKLCGRSWQLLTLSKILEYEPQGFGPLLATNVMEGTALKYNVMRKR